MVVEPNGLGGGTITGRYDHGPWGETVWQSAPEQRLSFIDKERDEESGDHNFGVRQYDNGIGRFMIIDPLWEQFPSISPYVYSFNSPLVVKDPSGKAGVAEVDHDNASIVIHSHYVFYGSGANDEVAQMLVASIEEQWNSVKEVELNGKTYKFSVNITYEIAEEKPIKEISESFKNEDYSMNYVRLEEENVYNNSYLNGNQGEWQIKDVLTGHLMPNYVSAHETGHGWGYKVHTPMSFSPDLMVDGGDVAKYGNTPYVQASNVQYILRRNNVTSKRSGKEFVNMGWLKSELETPSLYLGR